ncbi:MAG: hypothetical protein KAW92_01860 [Candidatus Cloacimonetes bacterium]|nr:hypothetical protein [Candidatus Cloacimonadota bacterium]
MNKNWLQSRVYFYKDKGHEISEEEYKIIFDETSKRKKIDFTRYHIRKLRDTLIGKFSDKWHFLGIYYNLKKSKNLYLDIRFRLLADQNDKCIEIIKDILNEPINLGLICEDIDFDDSFYENYNTRFTESQINTILDIFEIFSNKYLELTAENDIDYKKIQNKINKEYFTVLKEVIHLILFQSDINDSSFYLLNAYYQTNESSILDLLISKIANNSQDFQESLKSESEINISKLISLILNNFGKYQ